MTDSSGSYVLPVPLGSYTVTVAQVGYLTATRSNVVVGDTPADLSALKLLSGNLVAGDQPEVVDIGDLARLGGVFGEDASACPEADYNLDGSINLFDLVAVASNYHVTENDYVW